MPPAGGEPVESRVTPTAGETRGTDRSRLDEIPGPPAGDVWPCTELLAIIEQSRNTKIRCRTMCFTGEL